MFVEKLPIPPITSSNRHLANKIEALVEEILTAKKANPKSDTAEFEQEIDLMVYALYGLTYEEVMIVEPEFALSREEYERLEF